MDIPVHSFNLFSLYNEGSSLSKVPYWGYTLVFKFWLVSTYLLSNVHPYFLGTIFVCSRLSHTKEHNANRNEIQPMVVGTRWIRIGHNSRHPLM